MTYNEWRDELKSNLLCVSESERRRVLDYYAEAYADRREAGFSEREIIEDFGAPYDAAQRILADNGASDYVYDEPRSNKAYAREQKKNGREERRREKRERRAEERERKKQKKTADCEYCHSAPAPAASASSAKREDYTWVFVLLCVIFCVPLFGLIMAMVGITVGLCVAPVMVIGSGAAALVGAIIAIVAGSIGGGICAFGIGVIVIGVGIILCPLFYKLVGLMWTLFKKFFAWLKSLFSGKEGI